MEYDVVVGIEIHIELKTATKMFSSAPYAFKKASNTCVSEVDLALPGTLPCVNKEAVRKAIEACTALHLNIDPLVKFDRKNYYYTDLPKGYQITQQFHPIGRDGYVEIVKADGTKKKIRINRIHMEEDTAKQFHLHDETLIDYNRAGVPLIEVVSEPDLTSGEEAALYVEKLRQIMDYLGVSDVKMEEGSMRCDTNISIKEKGSKVFGTKVEIKNLNSIANIQTAVDYETKRQAELIEKGEEIVQETRRFDEKSQTTITMRKKEGSVDYKYFPEPNIFPIRLSDAFIKEVQDNMPELPEVKALRYEEEYGLSAYDISVLLANKALCLYYEDVMKEAKNAKTACNLLTSELVGVLTKANQTIEDNPISATNFAKLVNMLESNKISSKQAKEILPLMIDGKDPETIASEKGMEQLSDESAIIALVNEVLDENEQSIIDFKNGKTHAQGYLVGQVMKKSKGKANPKLAAQLVASELAKR